MGKAAYDRGSRAISLGIRRSYGLSNPEDFPSPKPVPRPADWGSATYQKALKFAQGLVRYTKSRNRAITAEDVMWAITEKWPSISKKTALAAGQEALSLGEAQTPRPQPRVIGDGTLPVRF